MVFPSGCTLCVPTSSARGASPCPGLQGQPLTCRTSFTVTMGGGRPELFRLRLFNETLSKPNLETCEHFNAEYNIEFEIDKKQRLLHRRDMFDH